MGVASQYCHRGWPFWCTLDSRCFVACGGYQISHCSLRSRRAWCKALVQSIDERAIQRAPAQTAQMMEKAVRCHCYSVIHCWWCTYPIQSHESYESCPYCCWLLCWLAAHIPPIMLSLLPLMAGSPSKFPNGNRACPSLINAICGMGWDVWLVTG